VGKLKIAFYWNASCGGCEEAVLDIGEGILEVLEKAEIVFWPVALDFKLDDLKKFANGEIDVSFINGGIRLSEQEHVSKLLRKKSKLVVAFGSCAHLGGVPGLANLWKKKSIFDYYYREAPTVKNPRGVVPSTKTRVPEGEIDLPEFYEVLKPLGQVVKVDYYVPGCPPPPNVVAKALEVVVEGELPPRGSVLGASNRALCEECPLNETKPKELLLKEFKRVHEFVPDPEKCLLAQGLPCLGPVTRGGCGAQCIRANMPCTGCFGPLDNVEDFGARAISFLASILDYDTEEEILKALEKIVDPVGLFYLYSLPSSLVRDRIRRK